MPTASKEVNPHLQDAVLQAEFEVICEEAQLLSKFAALDELAAEQGLIQASDAGCATACPAFCTNACSFLPTAEGLLSDLG